MTNVTPDVGLDPIFVSVKQAAQMLGLSTWVMYELLNANKIDSRYQGRRRLVLVNSLRAYADDLPTKEQVQDEAAV